MFGIHKNAARKCRNIGAFVHCKSGASALEYAVIAAFLSVAIVVSVQNLGTTVRDDMFLTVQNALALDQSQTPKHRVIANTPASDPIITGSSGKK